MAAQYEVMGETIQQQHGKSMIRQRFLADQRRLCYLSRP